MCWVRIRRKEVTLGRKRDGCRKEYFVIESGVKVLLPTGVLRVLSIYSSSGGTEVVARWYRGGTKVELST